MIQSMKSHPIVGQIVGITLWLFYLQHHLDIQDHDDDEMQRVLDITVEEILELVPILDNEQTRVSSPINDSVEGVGGIVKRKKIRMIRPHPYEAFLQQLLSILLEIAQQFDDDEDAEDSDDDNNRFRNKNNTFGPCEVGCCEIIPSLNTIHTATSYMQSMVTYAILYPSTFLTSATPAVTATATRSSSSSIDCKNCIRTVRSEDIDTIIEENERSHHSQEHHHHEPEWVSHLHLLAFTLQKVCVQMKEIHDSRYQKQQLLLLQQETPIH